MSKYKNWENFYQHEFDIRRVKLGQPITLHAWGDIHDFTELHCEDTFTALCEKWSPEFAKGNHYALLLGDSTDSYRQTDQIRIESLRALGTDLTKLSDLAMYETEQLAKKLDFMKGCLLSAVSGNHGYILPHLNISLEEYLARMLKGKYGGAVCMNIIRLHTYSGKHVDIQILTFHGRNATMLIGSNLNECERASYKFPTADVIVSGHAHQLITAPVAKMMAKYGEPINQHETHLIRIGSMLRNFVHGKGGYSTVGLLRPSVLRFPRIVITLDQELKGTEKVVVPHIEIHS